MHASEREIGHALCRDCMETKKMLLRQPAVLHALLAHLTQMLITYVCHQIDCGAQVTNPLQ